jgi:hypothetical protein
VYTFKMTKCTSNCTIGKCTNLGAPLPPHPASSAFVSFSPQSLVAGCPMCTGSSGTEIWGHGGCCTAKGRVTVTYVGCCRCCVPGLWFVFVCCCAHASSAHHVLFAVRWTVVHPDHEQHTSRQQGFTLFYAPLTQPFTSFEVMCPHKIGMMEGT